MNMKPSKWATTTGFRLIRIFTMDHNAERYKKHVEKWCKARDGARRRPSRYKMQARRRSLTKGANA